MRVAIVILCLVGAAMANPIMVNTTMDSKVNPLSGVSSVLDSLELTGVPELKAHNSSESESSEQSNTSELKSTSVSSSSSSSSSSEASISSEQSHSASVSDSSSQSETSEQSSSQENTSEDTTSESSESDESESNDLTSDESPSKSLEDTTSEESHSLEDKFNVVETGVTRDDTRGSKENLRRFFKVYAVKATRPTVSDSHQSEESNSISNEIPEATAGPSHSIESISSEDSKASMGLDLGNSTEDSASVESTENNSAESTESNEDSEAAVSHESHESHESKSAECPPGSDQDCDSDSDESNMRDIGDAGDPEPFDGLFMPFDTPRELMLRR